MKKQSQNLYERVADGVDNVIGVFSPAMAAKRKMARFAIKHMLGAYRGADTGRLRGNWIPGGGSADQDLIGDLPNLRERSRDLVRNDGIASGAIDTIVTNIIGTGISPQSRVDRDALAVNEEYADKLQKKIEKIWYRWCECADAGERLTFYEIEELVERNRLVNGENIVIPLRVTNSKKRRPYNLALQVVEADRLATPTDLTSQRNIRAGVEVGERGEPLAYWIRKNHPGDLYYTNGARRNTSDNYIRYKAYNDIGDQNIFHLYHLKRAGQTRGEPFFTPVINLFKDRADYMEAELVAARVAACFAVFIKKELGLTIGAGQTTEENGKHLEELSPGIIERLKPGESIEAFNPNRPGGTFGLFMERLLRDMAAGMNMPYEILSKDFSKSNYSNTRAAFLEARRFFKMQQLFVVIKLCQPVLAMLLEEAYLRGELDILDFYTNREAYVRCRWITPGWQWVDPQNEVKSSIEAVNNNLSTLAEEAASQGRDWEEDVEQRARELKKIKDLEEEHDITMTPEKAGAPVNEPDPEKKDAAEEEEDGQKTKDGAGNNGYSTKSKSRI